MMARVERAGLADWLGRILAVVFVVAAGAVALQMAYAAGADEVRRWTMVGIVCAGLAVVAFGPGLTLGRGRVMAALLLLPVWASAVGYNSLSALDYFDRYLADADARARIGAELFREQRDTLARLRLQREAIRTVRSVVVIEAERERRGIPKATRDRLEVELQDAKTRDDLDDRIRAAAAELAGATARAQSTTDRSLAPLFRWLSTATGYVVASNADLRALLLLAITELGAALVPVAMALASGRRRGLRLPVWRFRRAGPDTDGPASGLAPVSGPDEARDVSAWMDARTCRAPGAMAPAADLYADYHAWATARGLTPMHRTRFGGCLSSSGLAKRKAGAAWTVNYLGIALRPPATSRMARVGSLFAIAGGRA